MCCYCSLFSIIPHSLCLGFCEAMNQFKRRLIQQRFHLHSTKLGETRVTAYVTAEASFATRLIIILITGLESEKERE